MAQTVIPFTTAGAAAWFCPAGVTSVTVECWGAGGAGGGATANPSGGGGGAGGAYTKATTIAVIPGTTYNLFVGAGGVGSTTTGPSGGSSWFNTNTTLLAVGGTGGGLASNGAGAIAPITGNLGGTTNFYGGNGISGVSSSRGGGGGGSAGTAGNGNAGSGATGGIAVVNGGAGANGSTSGNGSDAAAVGGGGGGGRATTGTDRSGGDGFNGKIVISYTTPGTYKSQLVSMDLSEAGTKSATSWCAGETRTVTVNIKNIGTAAWIDIPDVQNINIGIKWNTNVLNWADYYLRVDAANLAPGATGTYSFLITASNFTQAAGTYTTPLAAGTNNLTFDVVYEAVSWFGNNGNGVGTGNIVFTSPALTINALTATAGTATAITLNSATIPGTINTTVCTAITSYGVEYSTTNGFANGGGTQVTGTNLLAGNFSVGLAGLSQGTIYYYHAYATNGAGTIYSAQGSFSTLTPVLTATALTAFGAKCINNTYGPNSFTITGTNLTAANVTVGALSGYTYSTTSGGTYTTSLSVTQPGGSFSQQIFVKFAPVAVTSFNGNISLAGGGAASINVTAAGSGVNSVPGVTSGAAGSITSTSATLAGTITANGCTSVTSYGVEYSTTNGFTNGTGTAVGSSNLSGSTFSVNIPATGSLNPGTTYYFHAYAINGGGTGYGSQGSFITIPSCATLTAPANGAINVTTEPGPPVSWNAAQGATSYDVYFGTTTTPPMIDNVTYLSGYVTGSLSNTTYYWYVVPRNSSGAATGCISNMRSFTTAAGPANDECAGAINLTVNALATSGTTVKADQTLAPSSCSSSSSATSYDVWYSFKATNTTQTITLASGSGFDGVIQAYSGSCGAFTSITCTDNTSSGGTETLNLSGLTICNTYYVRVYGYYNGFSGNPTGTFTIKVAGTSSLTAPASVSATPNAYCTDNTSGNITLTASGGSGGTITWYSGSCGGTPVGTGATLTIAKPITTTAYYARRENSCDASVCASTTVTVNALPTVYNVTGGGAYCSGGTGSSITLSGSETGVSYQVYKNGTATGSPYSGTGSSITTTNITAAGIYTVIATKPASTCQQGMTGSATISLITRPTGDISGTQVICYGQTPTVAINVTGTGPWSGTLSNGQAFSGTSSPVSVDIIPAPTANTSYTILTLTDANCTAIAADKTGAAAITVTPAVGTPATPTPTAATICQASLPTTFTTAASNATSYNWSVTGSGNTISGTGASATVSWSAEFTGVATVSVTANGCNGVSAEASTTVTVTETPSATISYGGIPYCSASGSALVIRTGTAGGTYSSTAGLSIDGITGTVNILASTPGNYTVTYTVSSSGCGIYTSTTTLTIVINTWTGVTSADWNDPTNWSCGALPDATSSVTIPSGTPNDPIVSVATATVRDIVIASGASVIVTGQTIQVAGSITNTGFFTISNGAIEFNGTSAQIIPANAFTANTIKDLIISNNVSLEGVDSLTGTVSFGSSAKTFTTNGNLILKSTALGTAAIGKIFNDNIINGDVTVERYIATGVGSAPNHGKSWQFLAVPTKGIQTINHAWQEGCGANVNCVQGFGTQITGSGGLPSGFDVLTSTPSMKTYNYLTNGYDGVAGTDIPVYNKKGYFVFVRGDRSIISAFAPATPTVLRSKGALFTPANLPPIDTVIAGKFESIGNPYASAVDMRNIIKTGGVDEFFQVWDPKLGGGTNYGALQTFFKNPSTGDYEVIPGEGSYGPFGTVNNYIQSGQAFMVQATGTDGTVRFEENSKASGSSLFSRPSAGEAQQMLRTGLLGVKADGSTYMVDGVLTSLDDSYSNAIDGLDAKKSFNTGENLSIKTGGQLLVIERKHPFTPQDTIFLNLTGVRAQLYQFQVTADNIKTGIEGFLEDNYMHTSTPLNLNGTTVVNFSIVNVPGSYANDRFRIVFMRSTLLPVTFTSVKAYRQDKKINVEWTVENEMNMKQYEVEKSLNGIQFTTLAVKTATANGGRSAKYVTADAGPIEGYNYYRVKSVGIDGKAAYTTVVKVLMGSLKQDITIYPNPITDGMIHLQLMNQPQGIYGIRLLNRVGQVIESQQINHTEVTGTELIKWDYNLAHGMYQLEVTKPDQTRTSISVVY